MHAEYFETHFLAAGSPTSWPEQFAIITGYATTGECWPDDVNRGADQRLQQALLVRGCWMRRLTGYSPRTGHREPGWACQLSADEALRLGREFRQHAIYFVVDDWLFVRACEAGEEPVSVGRFSVRVRWEDYTAITGQGD